MNFAAQSDKETVGTGEKSPRRRLEAAKPYLTAFLIVTILLSVWVGLCAA